MVAVFLTNAHAESTRVTIADPFIELRTGPDDGYPPFAVAKRGETIEILLRKADWFKVRTERGTEGWTERAQLEKTLTAAGDQLRFLDAGADDFLQRRWELGGMAGDYEGATAFTVFGNYALTRKLGAELAVTHAVGDYASHTLGLATLTAQPFPQWRVSPYVLLGTGAITTDPDVTLVQAEDRTDALARVGAGARIYLTRRFLARVEYSNYVIFSSNDDNEDPEEWKAGFAVFF